MLIPSKKIRPQPGHEAIHHLRISLSILHLSPFECRTIIPSVSHNSKQNSGIAAAHRISPLPLMQPLRDESVCVLDGLGMKTWGELLRFDDSETFI